ncbi:MAG: hypothetical protein HQ567_27555 [Candidatus Nealsonbacteria bacterium]|nr:hypothetical protein [Candidatus Nealsonbacteria bacterium]
MQGKELVTRLGSQISPTAVREYAKSRGWQPVEGSRRRLWIFRHPKADLRQLIIPIDQDAAWADALLEVVLRLAALEQSAPETVLDNLLTTHSDVVRFRVGGEDVSGGMLPMADAADLIKGATRALLSSACSVINKVTHHPRMSRSESEEFLRVCKMGQTEIGSYVVKAVCPLMEMNEPPLLREDQPFARATTTILIEACQAIVQSIEEDRVDGMLEANSAEPTVTSNLCDELLRMHAARDNANLTIEVSWAAIPKYKIPSVAPVAAFKPEYFHVVEDIQRQLRPQKEQHETAFLFGTVETLNGDVGEDGHRSGEVVFALLLQDEEVMRARGNLNAEDYAKAVAAHEEGRGYVSFSGVLKRGVRVGRVETITEFRELASKNVPQS